MGKVAKRRGWVQVPLFDRNGRVISPHRRSFCKGLPLSERLWSKVRRAGPDECWLFTGALESSGYGHLHVGKGAVLAHRLAYELERGPVPPGLFVLHRCDVRACCNPAHLFPGTNADNMQDMLSKGRGRQPKGERQGRSKLTEAQVRAIREAVAGGRSQEEVGREFGVSQNTVSGIVRRVAWKHVA